MARIVSTTVTRQVQMERKGDETNDCILIIVLNMHAQNPHITHPLQRGLLYNLHRSKTKYIKRSLKTMRMSLVSLSKLVNSS